MFNNSVKGDSVRKEFPKELERAMKEDPEGITCAKCGKENDLYDDIGWFYSFIAEGQYKPICVSCYGPLTGDR